MTEYSEEWEEAIKEAKEELGVNMHEYVGRRLWNEIVETAKENLQEEMIEEGERMWDEIKEEYRERLNSEDWKKLREAVLIRDRYLCKDCKKLATQVHHISYEKLECDDEIKDCISLCRSCHKKRHGIQ